VAAVFDVGGEAVFVVGLGFGVAVVVVDDLFGAAAAGAEGV